MTVLDSGGNVVNNLGFLSPWNCTASLVTANKFDDER